MRISPRSLLAWLRLALGGRDPLGPSDAGPPDRATPAYARCTR